MSEYHKKYYLLDRERILKGQKEYYGQNREKILEYHKTYYVDNKQRYKEYAKQRNDELKAKGLCTQCKQPKEKGRLRDVNRCNTCRIKYKQMALKRRKQKNNGF